LPLDRSPKGRPSNPRAFSAISVSATYFDWQKRGKAGEQPYETFFFAVTRAREQHRATLIAIVLEAAHKDARHAEWLLERQFPHEFAPYDRRPTPVEPEPLEKKINVAFIVDTKGKSLEEVASFPVLTPEEIAQKAPEREPEPNAGRIVRRQYRQARKGCARCAV